VTARLLAALAWIWVCVAVVALVTGHLWTAFVVALTAGVSFAVAWWLRAECTPDTGADHIAAYRHWLDRRGWDHTQRFYNECTNCGTGPSHHRVDGDDGHPTAPFQEFTCP